MKSVYHFTDEPGFRALSSGAVWYPSTGVPFARGRSLLDHLQLSVLRAQELFYREQYETRNYVNTRSSQCPDVHYGPGWYVTEASPDSDTSFLLEELWQGRADCVEKTRYWLKLLADENRLKRPDGHRPSVAYLPLYNSLGGGIRRPAGINGEPALLVEAGSRTERPGRPPEVKVLHSYDPPIETVPSLIAVIDGWEFLDSDKQCNILGFMGFDSGYPGVPFPEAAVGLSVNTKQLFAIAQIAARSLGTAFDVIDVIKTDSGGAEEVFSFDIVGKLTLRGDELTAIIHCRHQSSPMRLEHADSLRKRASTHAASFIIALVTSTFAQNALQTLVEARAAPILITSLTSAEVKRPAVRIAIMDGEVVQYPDHCFWFPVLSGAAVRFEQLRSRQQILWHLGWSRLSS